MIGSNSFMHKHLTALHSLHASVGVPVPSFVGLPMPLVMAAVGTIHDFLVFVTDECGFKICVLDRYQQDSWSL